MSSFIHSSAVLFVIDTQNLVKQVSVGAASIGIKADTEWTFGLSGVCTIATLDYLITADMSTDSSEHFFYLQPLAKQQIMVKALQAMSQCILDDVPLVGGKLGAAMAKAVSTLNEAIKQGLQGSIKLEKGAEELTASAKQLTQRSTAVSTQLAQTLASTNTLDQSIQENMLAAAQLTQTVSLIDVDLKNGQLSVEEAQRHIDAIRTRVSDTQGIVDVIDEIAFKTNLLSLNAAVEAARAGEKGRGFSIVAQEVRALAGHSANQANEIRSLLKRAENASDTGQKAMEKVSAVLGKLFTNISSVTNNVADIEDVAENQKNAMRESAIGLTGIEQINAENTSLASSLSVLAQRFSQQTRNMRDSMEVFRIQTGFSHPKHEQAFAVVREAAMEVGHAFEQAISRQLITSAELFSREYRKSANTDPIKYTTQFDRICDKILPSIQEKYLLSAPFIVYLISTDDHGYVPTHNNKFCQVLTGDKKHDLVNNRTKRIFTDRVGQSAGTHEEEYLLLTYRRDTGEVLIDLSCPIYVNGRHWGGVRCGYSL